MIQLADKSPNSTSLALYHLLWLEEYLTSSVNGMQ